MRMLSGIRFLGRPLKVRPCDQKRVKGARCHSDRLISNCWQSRSRQCSQRAREDSTRSPAADLLAPIREHRRVYVGNPPKPVNSHASDLEIRDLFKEFDIEAASKVKWPNRGQCMAPDSMRLSTPELLVKCRGRLRRMMA
ncbi:hypothetical protein EJ02DRAFT_226190 [Clathrospora elynae]|uniref:Uncharacterized protein n=1 Tax=Clathrospora elynae TaxID=706981 RepID=A0A6A5SL80_9PLEO|nr:hypothetical protein EJ02DRAFT_226190 [Clathrospora elynae]